MIDIHDFFDITQLVSAIAIIAFVIFYIIFRQDMKEIYKDVNKKRKHMPS